MMKYQSGQVVKFTDKYGRGRFLLVEEVRRGCVRGFECNEKGSAIPDAKKWRVRFEGVRA